MLLYVLLGIALITVIFLVAASLQPNEFKVERSALMAAPAEVIFPHINDLRKWDAWSPWAKMDPAMAQAFSSPSDGEGATYHWKGNKNVGEGEMTIAESRPSSLVRISLRFIKPFPSTCPVHFTLTPSGDKTQVTWAMSGKKIFLTKAIGIFMSMDDYIGKQYDQGLAAMKAIVEAEAGR